MRLILGKGATASYKAKASPVTLSRAATLQLYARQHGIRSIQIKAAPLGEQTVVNGVNLPISSTPGSVSSADAKFHVVGAPYSMLSVCLSASQTLHTRRGTLVGLSGKAEP